MTKKEILSDLLRTVLNQPVNISEELGSNVNHTYIADIDDNYYIVKFITRKPLHMTEQNRFLKTEYIFKRLQSVGIDVPEVIYVDNKKRQINGLSVYGIIVMERIDIDPLDVIWDSLDQNDKEQFVKKFANLLKKIHTIEFDQYGGEIDIINLNHPKADSTWKEYILEASERAHSKLLIEKVIDQKLLDASLYFIKENIDIWNYTESPKLVHADIWRGNFMWDKDSDLLYGIDWEWSLAGDPDPDLLWIESDILYNEPNHLKELFFEQYGRTRNDNYWIKFRVLSTFSQLASSAFGFIAHNPSKENIQRLERFLKHFVFDRPMNLLSE